MVFTKVAADHNVLHIAYYETKLKKQGMVDLALENAADLSKIHDDDSFEVIGLHDCIPGDHVTLIVHHPDHSVEEIPALCA